MRLDAKIAAREWIVDAIQKHSCLPDKDAEREIRRFLKRLQRDMRQLRKARERFKVEEEKRRRDKNERVRQFEHAISK